MAALLGTQYGKKINYLPFLKFILCFTKSNYLTKLNGTGEIQIEAMRNIY